MFKFNHIDPNIDPEILAEIKELYKFYHKRSWCFERVFKRLKRLNLAINLISVSLVATGTIAGGVTLNPIILGVISGAGLLLKTISEIKNLKNKIEMAQFARNTYEKTLVDLRSCLRGNEFNHSEFLDKMKTLDEIIVDLCISTEKFEKLYNKKF